MSTSVNTEKAGMLVRMSIKKNGGLLLSKVLQDSCRIIDNHVSHHTILLVILSGLFTSGMFLKYPPAHYVICMEARGCIKIYSHLLELPFLHCKCFHRPYIAKRLVCHSCCFGNLEQNKATLICSLQNPFLQMMQIQSLKEKRLNFL